jgi:hypothetical protein
MTGFAARPLRLAPTSAEVMAENGGLEPIMPGSSPGALSEEALAGMLAGKPFSIIIVMLPMKVVEGMFMPMPSSEPASLSLAPHVGRANAPWKVGVLSESSSLRGACTSR